jgi:nitrile hydratase subunit beta
MNGVHDMGGMHGFGRVEIERDEPMFHEAWEGRMWGMLRQLRQLPGKQPPSARPIIESMEPVRYLTVSYYERFLHALEIHAVEKGLVTREELDARTELFQQHPEAPVPRRSAPTEAARAIALLTVQARPEPSGPLPQFKVGDLVAARNLNPAGHTRLPRYIRGKRGVIERVNGWYRLQDEEIEGLGPNPQTVYTVRFPAREVWGPRADPYLTVYLEMWEGYLEPAEQAARYEGNLGTMFEEARA